MDFADDDYDYESLRPICPICRRPALYRDWYGEDWIEETLLECESCGYVDHYAYGATEVRVGNEQFCYSYADDDAYKARVAADIEWATKAARIDYLIANRPFRYTPEQEAELRLDPVFFDLVAN